MSNDEHAAAVTALLEGVADGAGDPPPLKKGTRRLARMRQLAYVTAGVLLAVAPFGAFAMVSGSSGSRSEKPISAAPRDTGSYRVFVVDSDAPGVRTTSVVWSARVADGRISDVSRIDVHGDADVALSPEGQRLYAVGHDVYAADPRDVLSVIDPRTGRVLDEETVPAWQGTTGFHLTDKIVASPDGTAVYVLVGFAADPEAPPQALTTYDVASGTIRESQIPLDRCGGSPILLPRPDVGIVVVCPQVRTAEFITVAATGAPSDRSNVTLPLSDVAAAGISGDGSRVYALSRLGEVVVIDTATQEIVETADIPLPEGSVVGISQLAVTAAGDKIVIGLDDARDVNAATSDLIASISTSEWSSVETTPVDAFSWFALVTEGGAGFTIDTSSARLAQFDPRNDRRPTPLGGLGARPVSIHATVGG